MDIKELYGIYREHPVVTTDSRNVPRGSLFFALRGESFDGNRFASAAIKAGAAFAIVDDPSVVPADTSGYKYILVNDSLEALQELAAVYRKEMAIPVIAITGTNGKTTSKELTAAVLSEKYRVHATYGNLNNHIGVPLTLLSMPFDTQVAVVEMGASAPGEIAALCDITSPDYGLITNIGRAHIEGFGSPEGIRSAKGELYDYLAASGGIAVVRSDDAVLAEMAAERTGLKTIAYDSSIATGTESGLAGSYNLYNIAAAMELGRIFGVDDESIASAIKAYKPSSDRSRRIDTGRNTVIADCYNANPSSMTAAIATFIEENPRGQDGSRMPKAVILGDMLELGRWSAHEHEEVLRLVTDGRIKPIYLVGDNFRHAYETFSIKPAGDEPNPSVFIFKDTASLSEHLKRNPVKGTFILVKGSRGVALESILGFL